MILQLLLGFGLTICVVILLTVLFYLHRRRCHKFFKRLGIQGPSPDILTGNLMSFRNKFMFETLLEWTETYGKIFGYFEGSSPVLVVSDPDAVNDVLVKKFAYFNARKDYPLLRDPEKMPDVNMFLAYGAKWKRLRSVCNPNFSSAKMKQMKPLMDKCLCTLLDVLEEKADEGKSFDIYPLMQGLTLDVIAETAFGVETNVQTDPANDSFFLKCQSFFNSLTLVRGPSLLMASLLLPELKPLWVGVNTGLHKVKEMPDQSLNKYVTDIISTRKTGAGRRVDLLQLMLDAQVDENGDKTPDALSDPELMSQSVLLLAAGYETTSTTMAFCIHLLATNPDAQEKLRDEIDKFLPSGDTTPSYEDLQRMTYLDMVLCETLRMYPVAGLVVFRKCMESCTIGSNIYVPESTSVYINVWALHYSAELWGPVDPRKFHPDRFTRDAKANRHPMAWVPFGGGPRYCLGMRFALLELKLALARLLRKFVIEPENPLLNTIQVKEGVTVTPRDGCRVFLRKRCKF